MVWWAATELQQMHSTPGQEYTYSRWDKKQQQQNKTNSDVRSIFKAVQLLVHQSMNMNEEIPQLLFAVGSSTGKSPLLGYWRLGD